MLRRKTPWAPSLGLLLLVGLLARPSVAADSLSVEECVAQARRLAPAVQAATLDLAAARGDSLAASLNGRPTVSLLAGGLVAPEWSYDPVVTDLGGYELKLSLDWTAIDGGRLARARRRGRLDLEVALGRAAVETRDTGLEAARLALQALRLDEEVVAQQRNLDWIDRLARLVRAGVSAGTRSPADSTRVDLEHDATVSALETATLDARTNLLELGSLLARAENDSFSVHGSGGDEEREPSAADSIRLMAVVDRLPEMQIARTAAARSRLDLLDARRAKSPIVTATLDAGLAGADLTHAVPPDFAADNPGATFADRLWRDVGASAAVHLRLPVSDPAVGAGARAREATARADGVRVAAEVTRLRRDTLSLLAHWRAAYRRFETARRTAERAEANLLRVKSLYSAGGTRLLDLLDARSVYEESRTRLADARQDTRWLRFQAEDRR